MNYPRDGGSPVLEYPLKSEGPADFFPPVCLQTHWDPTKILRRTLPEGYVPQQLDPRPWTRICLQYTTAGEDLPTQSVPSSTVMPSGGQFYPPSRYSSSIDAESQLRRLDRPLGTCEADQWEPRLSSDMFDSRVLVPRTPQIPMSRRIEELAYPQALIRDGPYPCRAEADALNVSIASDYLFNNATKQDRYKTMGKAAKPASPEKPLMAAPERLRPDLTLNAARPSFAPGSYGQQASYTRADLIANAKGPVNLASVDSSSQDDALKQQATAFRTARGLPPMTIRSGQATTMESREMRAPMPS